MAFIPEDKLLEIKDAARIEEVVGQYVQLQQRGKNLLGLCPFHPDTAPSFTVSPDKGIFHCFGCGAGGNVFSFLMQHQRLSFPEAVQELARRYGITITMKDLGPEGGRQAKKRQLMQEINKEAAAFYQTCLAGAKGEKGRGYVKKRGLTKEVVRDFHVGYAPEEWDALSRHLQNRGISLDAAQEVGLLVPRQNGGYYDRFRDRLMFPILDRQERVIAFGGRIIGPGEPKYLNSPESPLYSKGRNLYGLPQAQESLRLTGVALVVEGYMDLLALRVHGIANVVATLGTALTREQVRLLKNQVAKVVLVFDGDVAGAKAMRRAFPIFASEGLAVRVLPLPAGLDPDTYAFQHGVELFQSPWEKAQPWFAFLVEELIAAHGLEVEGRVSIAEELRPYFQALSDPVEQGLWLHFAGERLGVDEAALRRSLSSSSAPVAARRLDSGRCQLNNPEERLLKWVLHHPGIVPLEELEEWAQDFENQELKCLMEWVIRSLKEDGALDHSLLIQRVEEEHLRQQICALTLGKGEPSTELLAAEWRRDRQMRRLRKALAQIKEELTKAAAVAGGDDLLALQVQKLAIEQQLQELKY
ncbi:MAG: DNA primase [Desulfobaccales bacterium]